MKVVCAWCDKDMGEKEPLDNEETTHGMCQECYDKQMEEVGVGGMKIELQFMPIKRKWRILIDGKAFPRRFSDRASAMREFEKQTLKAEGSG